MWQKATRDQYECKRYSIAERSCSHRKVWPQVTGLSAITSLHYNENVSVMHGKKKIQVYKNELKIFNYWYK